jgi:aldehyde:ferredoxin oxidoreductase
VDALNAITMANYMCNEYGLDTISTGATIAFAMECYQRGILDNEQTGGIALEFGNGDLVVELVERIGKREGIGNLLAEGSQRMADRLAEATHGIMGLSYRHRPQANHWFEMCRRGETI